MFYYLNIPLSLYIYIFFFSEFYVFLKKKTHPKRIFLKTNTKNENQKFFYEFIIYLTMLPKTFFILFFVLPAFNANEFRLKQKPDSNILKNNSMNNNLTNISLMAEDLNTNSTNTILMNNARKQSEKAENLLNKFYYSFSFMEDELIRRIIFVMMLVVITIVLCCLSLQVLISLTKNCRLALNEISYREKKQKALLAFQDL